MEENPEIDTKLKRLIAEGTADGIGVGIALWVQNERLPRTPTEKSARPIDDLCLLFTADYQEGKPGYPFEEQSLKAEIDAIVSEHIPALKILFYSNDLEEVKKLTRYLVAGQVLEFIKPKSEKVKELMDKIRNEGLSTQIP